MSTTPATGVATASAEAATDRVSVVVAHSAQIFADGLSALLADAEGTIEVLRTVTQLPSPDEHGGDQPDVLVVDPVLVSGPDHLRALTTSWPRTRVLLLADADLPEHNIRLLAAGAAGLVDRSIGADAVANAVLATAQGLGLAPSGYIKLAADRLAAAFGDWFEELSDEELQLWQDVAQGLDYGAIAERRYVSERTARRHVDALLARLGVDNRFQAAELAGRVFLRDRPTDADPT